MSFRQSARRILSKGKQVLLPKPPVLAPAEASAWRDAVALWEGLFTPFDPVVEGADVLELGCGDGRLLAALLHSGRARSAVGLDRAAYWTGAGSGVAWRSQSAAGLQLYPDLGRLESFEAESFDLILARELDGALPLDDLEERLERIHALLRPGGEAIVRLRCRAAATDFTGPGYGFLTPTAWLTLVLRAGFEVMGQRRIWRDATEHDAMAALLPDASDDERQTGEVHLHLVRPWESWELDQVREYGDQRRHARR